jgi:GNAT superfamily N-acetyltransferase
VAAIGDPSNPPAGEQSIIRTASLLAEVFPHSDIGRPEYLRWLYLRSPFGEVIEQNLDDDQGRAAHYALVPITLAGEGAEHPAALSLNTAVARRARGSGVFVRLARAAIEEARARGVEAVVGVANANSTPGFVRRLGFTSLGPLPAKVLIPQPGGRAKLEHAPADPEDTPAVATALASLLRQPSVGQARLWSPETLAWRLARPGAGYVLHFGAKLLAISCVDRRRVLPVPVILKIFYADAPSRDALRALVRSVCAAHRAPFALHIGTGLQSQPSGLPLPGFLRDSPLNLIYRDLREDGSPPPRLRFELLDFDAY